MKIAQYIGDLLFQYECIVIPGFGGFITKEMPAKINPIQNHFIPPTKDIVFNVHLKANDGLLINHIVRAEKISYSEAKKRLEKFIGQCEDALKAGKRIHFRKVGTLFINEAGFKQFEPDITQNYLADSYGLKSFISPAIKRTTGGRPINKQSAPDRKATEVHRRVKAKKEAVKPKGPKYIHINISAVIILLLISFYVIFNFADVKRYYNNHSSLIPFFYNNANDYIIANYAELAASRLLNIGDDLKDVSGKLKINYALPSDQKEKEEEIPTKVQDAEPIETTYKKLLEELKRETGEITDTIAEKTDQVAKEIKNTKPLSTIILKNDSIIGTNENYKYHIIAGSFQNLANADKLVLQLKQKGFDARIAGKNKYDYYRVAYNSYNVLSTANQQLAYIRKEENSSAWILSN